ncbi:MAG TPA: SDR family oxidoreductase [Acidimicrobiales bacterium]|jgi:NAD(P)-dependent dehydrogenase (short-subunit alcohol dehydrogenase family)|nr:SDR family oxidoreductase [Acidimicrobiales bacterium]
MTTDLFGLTDRAVVVAGAGGGGVGTAVCRLLDAVGARIVALDIDAERLAMTEQIIDTKHGRHVSARCDVRDEGQVIEAVARAVKVMGPLHGLVHVAGGIQSPDQWQPTRAVPLAQVREVFRLNLEGGLLMSQAIAQHLIDRGDGGSIVLVSSLAGVLSAPFSASYGAAKAALLSLMRTEAVEWGPFGIRVNAIAPGTIRTPRTMRSGGTAEDAQDERDAIPLGRRGRPEEVAGAALFLMSELAAFVSGQVLAVDGASSVKPSYLDPTGLPVFVRDPKMRARLQS